MKNYEVDIVLNLLKKKQCEIKGKFINISSPYEQGKIGNSVWGKIDFLIRQGFQVSGFHDRGIYLPIFNKREAK
jgi:hypothetical protein